MGRHESGDGIERQVLNVIEDARGRERQRVDRIEDVQPSSDASRPWCPCAVDRPSAERTDGLEQARLRADGQQRVDPEIRREPLDGSCSMSHAITPPRLCPITISGPRPAIEAACAVLRASRTVALIRSRIPPSRR